MMKLLFFSFVAIQCIPSVFAMDMFTYQSMTHGGDDRLHLNPASKMNKYCSSSLPDINLIMRSSSTSSRPLQAAFDQADRINSSLTSNELLKNECSNLRIRIKKAFVKESMWSKVHVICTPSGTDAEMFFSTLALSRLPSGASDLPNQVCNIILAAGEVGSGTEAAAELRHFSEYTPLGDNVLKGSYIAGATSGPVCVRSIKIRDGKGSLKSNESLECQVEDLVIKAREKGQLVVLHKVHSAKTGVGALSDSFLIDLKKQYGDAIILVADVAQGRCSNGYISRLLKNNICVLLSGSKFFSGAPFSGVVFIPDAEADAFKREIVNFPRGMSDYFSAYDVDESLPQLRDVLNQNLNRGLMLRWETGLHEIEKYYSYDARICDSIAQLWVQEIKNLIARYDQFMLCSDNDLPDEVKSDYVGSVNTICSFLIKKEQDNFFGIKDLRHIYSLLTEDIHTKLPADANADELALGSRRCLIGQPVELAPGRAALRVSLSAPMVSSIAQRVNQGGNLEMAIQTIIGQEDEIIFKKLALIIKYFSVLNV